MSKQTEALKLALETAEGIASCDWRKWEELASPEEFERWVKSRALHMATALREALAEQPAQQQEPVGKWMGDCIEWTENPYKLRKGQPIYTSPQPASKSVTDEQLYEDAFEQGVHEGSSKAMRECRDAYFQSMNVNLRKLNEAPQRKPLTDEMVKRMKENCTSMEMRGAFADGWLSAEAAHGIKENT